jgi:DNA replication and repair protein RecF
MKINSLRLQNFRNLKDVQLDFSKLNTVGFLGDNGQGKTNFLESIYLLSSGSSWRTSVDGELITYNKDYARIDGIVIETEDTIDLALVVQKDADFSRVKKTYIVNDIKRKKETFTHQFPTVLFYPEDLSLVSGSPSLRRKALDHCLAQVFPRYSHALSQYGKVMVSRNRVLEAVRDRQAHMSQLEYWTSTLIQLGVELYGFRFAFFEYMSSFENSYVITYTPKIDCFSLWCEERGDEIIKKSFADKIHGNIQKEILSATTQYGPHKDDFIFYLNGKDLSAYGSRGEQRAGVLEFKKMQLKYIEHIRKQKPVLLLDDIFSEFDKKHRHEIALLTSGYQTFITGTEEQFFLSEGFGFDSIYRVENGDISL